MRSLLVLGLGNPILRDDAAGLITCEMAREKFGLNPAVSFKALCIGGFDLIYEIEGYDALIVVDAFHEPGGVPGRVRLLSARDLRGSNRADASGHLLSLPRALELSRRLGYQAPKLLSVVVIEVGDEGLEFGENLSQEVEAAIPVATEVLCEQVNNAISSGARDVWEKHS